MEALKELLLVYTEIGTKYELFKYGGIIKEVGTRKVTLKLDYRYDR